MPLFVLAGLTHIEQQQVFDIEQHMFELFGTDLLDLAARRFDEIPQGHRLLVVVHVWPRISDKRKW